MNRWIALGVFLVLTAAPALARAQGSAAEEAAIREAHKQYGDAWKARDAAKLAGFYADDATLVNEPGMEAKGRTEIERAFAQVMSRWKVETISGTLDTIRFIRPDLALLQGATGITGGGTPPGGLKGHYMAVATKQGGSWKIVAAHSAAMPPPPPQE